VCLQQLFLATKVNQKAHPLMERYILGVVTPYDNKVWVRPYLARFCHSYTRYLPLLLILESYSGQNYNYNSFYSLSFYFLMLGFCLHIFIFIYSSLFLFNYNTFHLFYNFKTFLLIIYTTSFLLHIISFWHNFC